jgi:hypothetical protein
MDVSSRLTTWLPRYLCITMNDRDLTRTSAHYKVVKDFVSWLSNTKRLYIRDVSNRCDRNFSTCRLKDCKNNEILTWDLVCHAAAWMKQVEHFGIDRGNCDVDLELVVKWLDFSKLSSLEVRKIEYNEKAKQHEEVTMSLGLSPTPEDSHQFLAVLTYPEFRSNVQHDSHVSIFICLKHK